MSFYSDSIDTTQSLTFNSYSHMRNELLILSGKDKSGYWLLKRIFDFFAALIMLIILSPLFLVVALGIYIDDPHGSPLFVQERVGRHGKKFKMYKFRTMVCNAEALRASLESQNEKDGPVFKMKNDPRVTKFGKFLRKTSIDELPQLINIVKGDMSFVGPRPSLPSEVRQYNAYQAQRLFVTPGLTCYWQTCHNRDDISFEKWVDLDIKYIYERSWFVDFKLIFKTIGVMLNLDGE